MAFDGTWKIDRSENYEKLMKAMGVNKMKRKLGIHVNMKINFQQDDNKFTVKESSNFHTTEIVFILGVNFDYNLDDGTELT
ncbi:FABPI protein, partial [Oreotrochilus melanogaster]|nr:FABPI protein [Oreotrochilus melanogaster]